MLYSFPRFQDFQLNGVQNISCTDALNLVLVSKAVIIDVREADEYIDGLPFLETGLFQQPLSSFFDNQSIPDNKEYIILMCAHGIRSMRLTQWLNQNGLKSAINMDGGFEAWKAKGLPVVY
jgi:rhodanese-related sulfurtransferase